MAVPRRDYGIKWGFLFFIKVLQHVHMGMRREDKWRHKEVELAPWVGLCVLCSRETWPWEKSIAPPEQTKTDRTCLICHSGSLLVMMIILTITAMKIVGRPLYSFIKWVTQIQQSLIFFDEVSNQHIEEYLTGTEFLRSPAKKE